MNQEVLHDIMAYFGRNSEYVVNEQTEINNELMLVGDDVDTFLSHLERKYNVDFNALNFDKFFLPELLFKYWYYKWFKPRSLVRIPVTVGHIVRVIEKGRWFDPPTGT